MSSALPIYRSARQQEFTAIAGQTTFGPVNFGVFSVDDLQVFVKPAGQARFSRVTTGFSIALSPSGPISFATVTFVSAFQYGDKIRVKGARVHERTTDVTRGGALVSSAMELEQDRQSVVLQELRRDIDAAAEDSDEARRVAEQALASSNAFLAGQFPEGGIGADLLADGAAAGNLGFIPENAAQKNQPGGYAGLGPDGQLDDLVQRSLAGGADVVALDNGIFDCIGALNQAKAKAGLGGVLRFRRVANGNYFFSGTGADLSGYVLDVEDGVVLSGYVQINQNDIEAKRPFLVKYNYAGVAYDYWVYPRPRMDASPVRGFLPPGDIETGYLAMPVGTSEYQAGMVAEKISWDTGDIWSADATASLSQAASAWTLTTQTELHALFTPSFGAEGPRKKTWFWGGVLPANVDIGIAVKCSQGWKALTVSGDGTSMTMRSRIYGGPSVLKTIPATKGRLAGLESWLPRQCNWGLVPLGPYAFAVMCNGVIIHRETTFDVGFIMEHGPAVRAASAGTHNVSALAICNQESTVINGGGAIGLVIIGDSKSDAVTDVGSPARFPVAWPHYAKAWLDGSGGIRITDFWNLAVAGATVADQLATFRAWLATPDAARATHVSINIGTNNGQSATYYPDFFNDLAALIYEAQVRSMVVMVDIFDEFYSRALAAAKTGSASQGQNVTLYQVGGPLRQTARQAALQYGCIVLDSQEIIGLELPEFLLNGIGEGNTIARMVDNIHGGAMYAAQKGYHAALKLRQAAAPRVSRTIRGLQIPNTLMLPGFTAQPSLNISLIDGAQVSLEGFVTDPAGTGSNSNWSAVNVMRVPRWARPRYDKRFVVENGGGMLGVGVVYANSGIIQIYSSSTSQNQYVSARWLING